jgi:hypothetical protein
VRCVLVVCLGLTLLAVDRAAGQKQCRKGIPCGNACIAATKVCHIGPPAAVAPTSGRGWVASSRGHTYYRRGRSTAQRLAAANLVYFPTEEDAQQAGYRRSTSRGC